MTFRGYDNLTPKIITAHSGGELEHELERLSKEAVFVDLQYGHVSTPDGSQQFSALALLQPKN